MSLVIVKSRWPWVTVESGNEPTCIAISRPASGDPGSVSVDSGESPPHLSVCLGPVVPWLSVWAQSSPGCLSGPSCPLVLDRGWKGFFWSLTLAVSHRDDPCVQTVQSQIAGQIVDPLASRRSSVSSQCLVDTPPRKDTGSALRGSWPGQRWDHSV